MIVPKIQVHAKQTEDATTAAMYFPMSSAEDSSSSLLSSSLTVDSQDIQHIRDNNDDVINSDDIITSNSQPASVDQAPAIAMRRSRWSRLGHSAGDGGGKGHRSVSFGKGVGSSITRVGSEGIDYSGNDDNNNNDSDDDDVCTVWRSCVASNSPPLSKVESQVLQAQLTRDGTLRQGDRQSFLPSRPKVRVS